MRAFDDVIRLRLDAEAATWLAQVMREEYERNRDVGALEIEKELLAALEEIQ